MEQKVFIIENQGKGLTKELIADYFRDNDVPGPVTGVKVEYLAISSYPFVVDVREDHGVHGNIKKVNVMIDTDSFCVAYKPAEVKKQYCYFVPGLIKRITITI